KPLTKINLNNIPFNYNKTTIHFNTTIKNNIITTIIKPNNSNKSTLLKILTQQQPISNKTIHFTNKTLNN
ncbi:hypothetical protein DF186_17020, partial [Enterococcus hirae]